jgi:formylglycine-generating enzyme required for sulfatase activity/serine/threonine protein kinase
MANSKPEDSGNQDPEELLGVTGSGPDSDNASACGDASAALGEIDDFQLLKEIGRGGMGVVYKAFQRSLQRVVAVKILNPLIAGNPSLAKRFRREAVLAANLSHPNIVTAFHIDDREQPRYFAMEFIEGRSLKEKIEADGFLAPAEAVRITLQACEALQHAHEHGIIHRDIKPANILLENHIEKVRITDFGIAQDTTGQLAEVTVTEGFTGGTPAFMSPEQNLGEKLDSRTDVFSLGATLYYTLTGKFPYQAANRQELVLAFKQQTPSPPSRFSPEIPEALDDVVLKMVVAEREGRHAQMSDVRKDLEEVLDILPSWTPDTVRHDLETASVRRPSSHHHIHRRIAVAVLCLLTAAVAIILWMNHHRSTTRNDPATVLLSENFDSNPGWKSGDSSNVRWDSSGFYRARVTDADTKARWGYSPLFRKVDFQSFSLEFDMCPANPGWGTYPLLALILDGGSSPHEAGALRVEAHSSGEGVNKFLLGSSQSTDKRLGWSPQFDTDTWYRHKIQYYAVDRILTWAISIRDSGLSFHSHTFRGVVLTPFNQAVIGYQGLPPVYGGWAEIYVDNIKLASKANSLDLGGDNQGQKLEATSQTLDLGNAVTMKLVRIDAGKFTMGSSNPPESPIHQVTISKPFYMGVTEVTHAQWKAVMNMQPREWEAYAKAGADHAVNYISWGNATTFCMAASKKTGRTVRLPTEAEWEYACRAATMTVYSFGHDASMLGDYAWFRNNARNRGEMNPRQVGMKKSNAWGLYDMNGNVWEWCSDWYTNSYMNAETRNPKGPATGKLRVTRGGAWNDNAHDCRAARRSANLPDNRSNNTGFRVVVEAYSGEN